MPEARPDNAHTARSVMSKLYDYLFSFDFFISYSRRGGQDYARSLYDALAKGQEGSRRFRCFLDEDPEEGFQTGHELHSETLRAINRASAMIVVVSREAFDSPHVAGEVELFAKTARQIFPIDIDQTLKLAMPRSELETELIGKEASAKMLITLRGRLFQSEAALNPISPCKEVIERINNAFKYTRKLVIRNVVLSTGVVLFATLAFLFGYFFYQEGVAREEAVKQAGFAKQQEKSAIEQRNVAVSRQLAAESVTMLGRDFDLALLLSVEANRVESTVEARASLIKALQAYPLLDSFGFHADRVEMGWFLHQPGEVSIYTNKQGDRAIIGAWEEAMVCINKNCEVIDADMAGVDKKKFPRRSSSVFRPAGVILSPDGKAIAYKIDKHRIIVWNDQGRYPIGFLSSDRGWLSLLAVSPGGKLLVAQEEGAGPAVYEVTTNRRLSTCANAAFADDGSQMALVETFKADNRTIILWDVEKTQERGRLLAETTPLNIGFSPNGMLLASSGAGNQVTIWDLPSMGKKQILETTSPLVRQFAFGPDNTTLAVAGLFDVTLWDLESLDPQVGKPFRPGKTQRDIPLGLRVEFCAGGKALAVTTCGLTDYKRGLSDQCAADALMALVEKDKIRKDVTPNSIATGKPNPLPYSYSLPACRDACEVVILEIPEMRKIGRYLTCGLGAVSADGTLYGAVSRDRSSAEIQSYSVASPKANPRSSHPEEQGQHVRVRRNQVCTLRLPSTQRRIRSLKFTTNHDAVLVTDDADCLVRWLLPPEVMRTAKATTTDLMLDGILRLPLVEFVQHIEWSPPWKTIRLHSGKLESERLLAFNQTENTMLTFRPGPNPVVLVRDTATSRVRALYPFVGAQGKPELTSAAPDGSMLASGTGDAIVRVLRRGEKEQSVSSLEFPAKVMSLIFTPQGRLSVVLNNGALWVWDSTDGKKRLVAPSEAESQPVAAVSPDGTRFVRAKRRSQEPISVELFDLMGNTSRCLTWRGDQINRLVISADNLRLAAQSGPAGISSLGNDSTTLWIWDLSRSDLTGRLLGTNLGMVQAIACSPDGKLLAALAHSHSDTADHVFQWDVPSSKLIGSFPVWNAEGIMFSPDGKTLATTGKKGTEFWDMDLESWTTKACRVANRNLTEKEWQQYFQNMPHKKACPRCPEPDIGGTSLMSPR